MLSNEEFDKILGAKSVPVPEEKKTSGINLDEELSKPVSLVKEVPGKLRGVNLDEELSKSFEPINDIGESVNQIKQLPEGMIQTAGRQFLNDIAPNIGGAVAFKGGSALFGTMGPVAGIVGGIGTAVAGEALTAKIQDSILTSLIGEANFEAYKNQLAINAKENPLTAGFAGMAASIPMMAVPTGVIKKGATDLIANNLKNVVPSEAIRIAESRFAPTLAGDVLGFGTMSAGETAKEQVRGTPGADEESILSSFGKGMTEGVALAGINKGLKALSPFLPAAKTFIESMGGEKLIPKLTPQMQEYLFNVGPKSALDALGMTLAGKMYDTVVEDKPFETSDIFGTTLEQGATFALMNGILGARAAFGGKALKDLSQQDPTKDRTRAEILDDFNVVPHATDEGRNLLQLKEGKTLDKDSLAVQIQANSNLDNVSAERAAVVVTEAAKARGMDVGQFMKTHGIAFGVVDEKPVGHVYEFASQDLAGPVSTLTKLADGTWKVENFSKRGEFGEDILLIKSQKK